MEGFYMKTKITSLMSITTLMLVLFIYDTPLIGVATNKRTDENENQSNTQKEEYRRKGTPAYNKAHPTQAKPYNQQIYRKPVPRETGPASPTPVPVPVPVETPTPQEQIQGNQQLMLQQLLPQKNTNDQQ